MSVLQELEPKRVFHYFEAISSIPHGSYDTKRISDYCVEFAKAHDLEVRQDEVNNVIIIKEASPGYETAETIMIQGHLDMVCEKTAESSHDFKKDGLRLFIDGDYIRAQDTTLGGDDGIAVAYALAILEDQSLAHPRLEVVLTSEEEVGMDGAKGLNTEGLKAVRLINLDSEEEGILLTSCAGGFRGNCEFAVKWEDAKGDVLKIQVEGLLGGHSGIEIDKGRGNSNKLMGRFLEELSKKTDYRIAELFGGRKDNVIPNETMAVLVAEPENSTVIKEFCEWFTGILRKEYAASDGQVKVSCEAAGNGKQKVLTSKDQERILFFLYQVPNGVVNMSYEIEGLVKTSLNLGVLQLSEEKLRAGFSVRSSLQTEKEALSHQLASYMEYLGGTYETNGDYPAWEYKEDSPLRDIMIKVYREQYQEDPKVEAVHAGLECGIILDKMPELDCVSLGPDIFDVHSVYERMSISSVKRVWDYLLGVLKECK